MAEGFFFVVGSSFYPEHHQYWGPYQHLYGEGIHTPWYKYGQTWPWTFHKSFPYSKYFPTYPYNTHFEYPTTGFPHVPGYGHLPSVWSKMPWLWEKYPSAWKNLYPLDITVNNHITTYPTVGQYKHLYPYGEHMYKPTYGKYIPQVESIVPHVEGVVPRYPFYNKHWETPVSTILPTVEAERFVGVPSVHEELPYFTPRYEKYMPFWYKYFGTKPVVPYHHETSEYFPYYRPYHYGLY